MDTKLKTIIREHVAKKIAPKTLSEDEMKQCVDELTEVYEDGQEWKGSTMVTGNTSFEISEWLIRSGLAHSIIATYIS